MAWQSSKHLLAYLLIGFFIQGAVLQRTEHNSIPGNITVWDVLASDTRIGIEYTAVNMPQFKLLRWIYNNLQVTAYFPTDEAYKMKMFGNDPYVMGVWNNFLTDGEGNHDFMIDIPANQLLNSQFTTPLGSSILLYHLSLGNVTEECDWEKDCTVNTFLGQLLNEQLEVTLSSNGTEQPEFINGVYGVAGSIVDTYYVSNGVVHVVDAALCASPKLSHVPVVNLSTLDFGDIDLLAEDPDRFHSVHNSTIRSSSDAAFFQTADELKAAMLPPWEPPKHDNPPHRDRFPPMPPDVESSQSSGTPGSSLVLAVVLSVVATVLICTGVLCVVLYARYKCRVQKQSRLLSLDASLADRHSSDTGSQPLGSQPASCCLSVTPEDILMQHKGTLSALDMGKDSCGVVLTKNNSSGLAHEDSITQLMGSWEIKPDDIVFATIEDGKRVKLGSGGFGDVYRGTWLGTTAVAVKFMSHTVNKEEHHRQLAKEICLLKSCRNNNIVQFYGAHLHAEEMMLVTEFLPLGDLYHALQGPMGERYMWRARGRYIALDIARGMSYLHSQRIIHCDLKSPNVLLGGNGVAKIGDLGMARLMTKEYVTRSSVGGTLAWAAPELLINSRITEKVDVFSFGVILWEIVTGQIPLRGRLRELRPGVDCREGVAVLFDKCVRPDPMDRPTAQEVYHYLEELVAQEAADQRAASGSGELPPTPPQLESAASDSPSVDGTTSTATHDTQHSAEHQMSSGEAQAEQSSNLTRGRGSTCTVCVHGV